MRFILCLILGFLFQLEVCSQTYPKDLPSKIQECLKESPFSEGNDPYRQQYEGSHTMLRSAKIIASQDGWYCVDNFRVSLEEKENPEDSTPNWNRVAFAPSRAKNLAFLLGLFHSKLPLRLGHLFALIEFEKGALLCSDPSVNLQGLVVSFEAMRKRSERYDMVEGMKDKYPGIFVLGSYYDVLQKAKLFYRSLEAFPLRGEGLASRYVQSSVDQILSSSGDMYHTILNSCITRQYDLLNMALPEGNKLTTRYTLFGKPLFRTMGAFFPGFVSFQLSRHASGSQEYSSTEGLKLLLDAHGKGEEIPFFQDS